MGIMGKHRKPSVRVNKNPRRDSGHLQKVSSRRLRYTNDLDVYIRHPLPDEPFSLLSSAIENRIQYISSLEIFPYEPPFSRWDVVCTVSRKVAGLCYERDTRAHARFRGELRVSTTHPENINTVHSQTARHSKCLMFSVCVVSVAVAQSVAHTNSSLAVPSVASSSPYRARHAPPTRSDHLCPTVYILVYKYSASA